MLFALMMEDPCRIISIQDEQQAVLITFISKIFDRQIRVEHLQMRRWMSADWISCLDTSFG